MIIHSVEFENRTTGQKIEKLYFDKLNLLIGLSGAGKTQILKTISAYITAAARDSVISSIQFAGHFKMEFSMSFLENKSSCKKNNYEVLWEIYTDEMSSIDVKPYDLSYGISKEFLSINGKEIIQRTKKSLSINEKENTPISPEQSVISVFTIHEEISLIKASFLSTVSYYQQIGWLNNMPKSKVEQVRKQAHKFNEDDKFSFKEAILLFSSLYPVLMRIDVVKHYHPILFEKFFLSLQDIFPTIEGLKLDLLPDTNYFTLFIKENGKWLPKDSVSSGMLKSVYILAVTNFSLSSVILLDELENSLGINCLDEITSYIVDNAEEGNSQFILTSHHPYIINNIQEKHWRIISQSNGVISSKKASDLGIDTNNNRQDRFFQLINHMQRQ